MPTVRLPVDPSVEHLRRLARRLQRSVRAGDPEAAAARPPARPAPGGPGFPLVRRAARPRPGVRLRQLAAAAPAPGRGRRATAATRTRVPPRPTRPTSSAGWPAWSTARRRPAAGPRPARCSPRTRTCRPGRSPRPRPPAPRRPLAAHLAADPRRRRAPGGPYGWEPLLYLPYSRLDADVTPTRCGRGPAAAGRRRRPGRRLPVARPDPAVHRAHRRFGEGEQGPRRSRGTRTRWRWPGCCSTPAPTRTTGRPSTTGCSAPTTTTSSCCSSTGSGRATAAPGGAGSATPLETPAEMLARPLTWAADARLQPTGFGCCCGTASTPTRRRPEGRAARAGRRGRPPRDRRAARSPPGAEPAELSPVAGLVAAVLAGDEADVARPCCQSRWPAGPVSSPGGEAGADRELAVRLGFDVTGARQPRVDGAAGARRLVRRLVRSAPTSRRDAGSTVTLGPGTPRRGGRLPGAAGPGAADPGPGGQRREGQRHPHALHQPAEGAQPGAVDQLGRLAGPLQAAQVRRRVGAWPASRGGRRASTPSACSAARWSSSRVSVAAGGHARPRRPSPGPRAR